ncbi:MAG TPA: glycosyltransferase [Marmoricola sp.]|nr:glycosyltransferase [Marmoricola sp.]
MREVEIEAVSLDRLSSLLSLARVQRVAEYSALARELLAGRVVWNVNATASGGGVAEMLQALLAYARGTGVETRWLVLDGTPDFFTLTKRLHNLLHGSPGDRGPMGDEERATYESVLTANVGQLRDRVSPGDFVLLHDPQTAGLVVPLRDAGAHVIWRSHIGRDTGNEFTETGWEFLRPYVGSAEATVFTRTAYVPDWLPPEETRIIPPSIDPFTAKNMLLADPEVHATLRRAGLVDLPDISGEITFARRDGTTGSVRSHSGIFATDGPVPGDVRYLLQVSRWDRLKDMGGVLTAFAGHLDAFPPDVHLVLAGPEVAGVADDPEGKEVLEECLGLWRTLPAETQQRVHLAVLPMDDVDENAHLVNALQQHASLVVQKSLVEGFGLTVTEPMWKARPVVASRIGGIQDQIVNGESGLLVDDPVDLTAFADACVAVLSDSALADRLGLAARERVRDLFIGDRQLIQYVDLFADLLAATGAR